MASPGRALGPALIALLLAGCTAATVPAGDPAGQAADEARIALDAVALEGAEVIERNASAVTMRLQGGLQETVVMPDGRRIFPFSDYVDLPLTLPPGVLLALDLAARSEVAELTLSVADDAGVGRCVVSSQELAPCVAMLLLEGEAPAGWTIRVLADDAAREGDPFELEARISILSPAGGGLPALPPAREGATPLVFGTPVVLADVPLSEPSLDITPGGTMYVSGYGNEPGALWRSTDGGATFERLRPTDVPYCNNPVDALIPVALLQGGGSAEEGTFHPGCGDIDVAVSGDDHVYFAHHWNGEAVHASHDGGATWTTSLLTTPELRFTDRAWLAADGERAWLAFNSGRRIVSGETGVAVTGDTVVSRTEDGGLTWAQVGQTDNTCIPGAFVHSPSDDRLYLGGCSEAGPTVVTSGDGGLTWETRLIAPREGDAGDRICYTCGIYTVLDVDDEGNLYAAWSDPHDEGTFDVWYATSQDQGMSWTEPVIVNGAGGAHIMPWLVAGKPGHAALAWYGAAQETDPQRADRAVWYVHVAETHDGLAPAPMFVETTASATPVQYGPICIGGTECGGARNLGDYLHIAFDPAERPVVAYSDGRGGGAWNELSRAMVVTSVTSTP